MSLENSSWVANFSFPVFSRKTQDSIDNCQVVKGVRREIVTSLAWEIWQHTQYPSLVLWVISITVYIIYNCMQGSWKVQLRQKLKNMRRSAETTSKKRTQEDIPSCSSSEATDNGTCTPSALHKSLQLRSL